MKALYEFEQKHQRPPVPGSATDASAVLTLAKSLAGDAAVSESFVEVVSRQAAGNLNAMAALYETLLLVFCWQSLAHMRCKALVGS